jgi:hypothetical protein
MPGIVPVPGIHLHHYHHPQKVYIIVLAFSRVTKTVHLEMFDQLSGDPLAQSS